MHIDKIACGYDKTIINLNVKWYHKNDIIKMILFY